MNPGPDAIGITTEAEPPTQARGFTARVAKGSLWSLSSQFVILGLSLLVTPIIVRYLGSEHYGIVVLFNLLPAYLTFADLGMGIASTRFVSEAHSENSPEKEGLVVRTTALISLMTSVPIGLALILFSETIVQKVLQIEPRLWSEAIICIQLAGVALVLRMLSLTLVAPALARFRMNLYAAVNVATYVVQAIGVLGVVTLGGSVVGVMIAMTAAAVINLVMHIAVALSLVPQIIRSTFDAATIKVILKYGLALAVSAVAAAALGHTEKFALTRFGSVSALAHYSIAATLAGMLTLFSAAVFQSLLPAFSQLQDVTRRTELAVLFNRSVKFTLIWLVPVLVFLVVGAESFLTFWVGSEFGRESSTPLHILLVGLAFNVVAYFPHALILAFGRTEVVAKIYWFELLPYVPLVIWLTSKFGAVGAAAAWCVRVIMDAIFMFYLAYRIGGVSVEPVLLRSFFAILPISLIPVAGFIYFGEATLGLFFGTLLCNGAFIFLAWRFMINAEERDWIIHKARLLVSREPNNT